MFARWVAFAVAATAILAGLTPVQPAQAAAAEAQAAATPEESAAELEAKLRTYLSPRPGDYSVSVRELDGDQRTVSVNGWKRHEPASTIKLFYAWAALRAIDRGTLSYDTLLAPRVTVRTCLALMIQISDNQCAIDIRLRIGMKNLNTLFSREGYANTYIALDSKGNYVTKRTTTDDLALLLSRLERGELLSEAQTSEFKKMLRAQIWRSRFASGVQKGTVVASKSGQLWVSTGMIEADTAIIYGPSSTYVLTAIGVRGALSNVIRDISTIVYRHLQGDITTKATFSPQQMATTKNIYLRRTPGGSAIRLLPAATYVEVMWTSRRFVYVKVGSTYGWVDFKHLKLRRTYLWPAPV